MTSGGHSRKASDSSAIENNKLHNEMKDLNEYLRALNLEDKSNFSNLNQTNTYKEEKESTI